MVKGGSTQRTAAAQKPKVDKKTDRRSTKQEPAPASVTDDELLETHPFQLLLLARLASAIFAPISDCDEVYNYWEPLHLLMYGTGMQTWEYSPEYALRSYVYILVHYLPGWWLKVFISNKIWMFTLLRGYLAVICAMADVCLYVGVRRRFGNGIGPMLLCFLSLSAGYFASSSAFLPSSFAMVLTSAAYGLWLNDSRFHAVMCIAASTLLGWPFAAILGVPIALEMLFSSRHRGAFFMYASASGVVFLIMLLVGDWIFYGKPVIAPLNIVFYNVFTSHGPDLYGVAPASYYVKNLLLNWNLAAVLACLALPAAAIMRFVRQEFSHQQWLTVFYIQVGYWLWLAIFFAQPHKEERFLFPIYPLIAVSAAVTLYVIYRLTDHAYRRYRFRTVLTTVPMIVCLMIFAGASLSRTIGQYTYFQAPFQVYTALNTRLASTDIKKQDGSVTVCLGKEWHRYPSSFFLPNNARLAYIKSEFAGLLPKPYVTGDSWLDSTRPIPSHMNDMNREERSRYIDVSKCDFLIDLSTKVSPLEPDYSKMDSWTVVQSWPFLIPTESNAILRAFYVPKLSEKYCAFSNYSLLERKRGKRNG